MTARTSSPGTRHRSKYHQAVDIPIRVGRHDARGYCSHPAVAAVVGHVLFESSPSMEERSQTLFKPFSDSRRLQLLAFAFTNQLSRSCPTENWRQRSRIDQAREIAASRLLDEINHKQVSSEDVEDLLEGAPTSGQLLHEASDLVQGTLTDQEIGSPSASVWRRLSHLST
jgi:hypothetical protein